LAWLWDYFAREATDATYNYAIEDGQGFPPLTRAEAISCTAALRDALAARGQSWTIASDLIRAQFGWDGGNAPLPTTFDVRGAQSKIYRFPMATWEAWRAAAELVRAMPASAPLPFPPPTLAWLRGEATRELERMRREFAKGIKRRFPDPRKMPLPLIPRIDPAPWLLLIVVIAVAARGDSL